MTILQNLPLPPTNNPHTLEAVQLLRHKVAASRTVSSNLADEVARNNTIIAQIRAVTQAAPANEMMQSDPKTSPHGQFSFLEDSASAKALGISPAQPAVQPLTTNTTFTLSQLPTVKAILTDLRSQLLNRSAMEQNRWSARDERRRERRDYIEQRTRSHLERNGQQSLTSTTGFREKQVDRDEIEAMEKAASVFETQR
jgi:kinetochore protein Mis12/MTW1